jgi:hypothetical protein
VDGRAAGFHAGVDGVSVRPGIVTPLDQRTTLGYGTVHITCSVVTEDAFRLRFEAGASMLSMPNSGAFVGAPYAGTVAFGPDFGVSGHLGLAGPIGLEGYARVTPFPVPVSDLRAALALRAGPFALTGGFRAFDVHGDGTKGPSASWSGPEVGLAVVF